MKTIELSDGFKIHPPILYEEWILVDPENNSTSHESLGEAMDTFVRLAAARKTKV